MSQAEGTSVENVYALIYSTYTNATMPTCACQLGSVLPHFTCASLFFCLIRVPRGGDCLLYLFIYLFREKGDRLLVVVKLFCLFFFLYRWRYITTGKPTTPHIFHNLNNNIIVDLEIDAIKWPDYWIYSSTWMDLDHSNK